MGVSIVSCPGCKSLLLSDTVQCPDCDHVLREDQAAQLPSNDQFQVKETDDEQVSCPDCGETVRKELVRCWQCGAFLREDIASRYQQMQAAPAPVTYSQLPEEQANSATASEPLVPLADDDDDFDLDPGFESSAAAPLAPLADEPAPTPPAEPIETTTEEAETIPLLKPEEPAAPAADETAETTAPAMESETNEATAPAPSKDDAPAEAPQAEGESHSVKTGGDALLDIAIKEEAEAESRKKVRAKKRRAGGFIVFCPNGHQVEVQERHRGMTGRCPKCKGPFHVPQANWDKKDGEPKEDDGDGRKSETEQVPGGRFKCWIKDMRVHTVDPTKLKLKAGSLESAFDAFDVAMSEDNVLVASMTKKGGSFFGGGAKGSEVRDEVLNYLAVPDHPIEDIPSTKHFLYDKDQLAQVGVVQPAAYAHESMFAGIAVFGEGRIALRLPKTDDSAELQFISFGLSEYRMFSNLLQEKFGIDTRGSDSGIPMDDATTEVQCHYSEGKFEALVLDNLAYYEADEKIKLDVVGRKCQECGLVVSEDSRKKEKIGGANGKGIAKAKCPKCTKKFGNITLFQVGSIEEVDTEPKIENVATEEPAEQEAE